MQLCTEVFTAKLFCFCVVVWQLWWTKSILEHHVSFDVYRHWGFTLTEEKITHRLTCSGNSHLPNDGDVSHIEKRQKAAVAITSPQLYIHFMKPARKSKLYHAYQVEEKDILDISKLAENYSNPKMISGTDRWNFFKWMKLYAEEVFLDSTTDIHSLMAK